MIPLLLLLATILPTPSPTISVVVDGVPNNPAYDAPMPGKLVDSGCHEVCDLKLDGKDYCHRSCLDFLIPGPDSNFYEKGYLSPTPTPLPTIKFSPFTDPKPLIQVQPDGTIIIYPKAQSEELKKAMKK